ncbi:2-phospho-L-lactate guanylyltransferase [Prauserella muralis]|uniref:2-phospho-L-lactate guanylyltransferase n=1 Tax=Prauserella muralis TaxID=588067 RepID=A0A2V4AYG1_9PSEU|nr:2-phospho-L-lactate guanylyltransferase [Prauserella muralis]PXY27051.1 2-phospho-L-lactate guanylyltransferase [Prauserella muralis]
MKPPRAGKSRLRGAFADPVDDGCHAALVFALAADTLRAATAAPGVRRVLVVGSDPETLAPLRGLGVEIAGEDGERGLNGALRAGERLLRAADPHGVVGALQADLPALRPAELAEAIAEAAGRRAFTADRHGTGTTLLLSAAGQPLAPRFGAGSARAHRESGALALGLTAPSLRGDVDTPADLEHARLLGLGERTATLLEQACAVS